MSRPTLDLKKWAQIKDAYLLGETSSALASRYGVAPSTIRTRASREEWTTPRNVKRKLVERTTKIRAQNIRGELTNAETDVALDAVTAIGESITEQQSAHKESIQRLLRKQIKQTKLPKIKSYKDLETADKIMRRTLDMDSDKQDTIINVGVLGSSVIIDDNSD